MDMRFTSKRKQLFKKALLTIGFLCSIIVVTKIALQLGSIANATTVGFSYLVLVVISAVFGDLVVATITSFVATLFFNYYFFPPVGTFRIASFDDWVALFAFLFTAIVISRLTASARRNARKAEVLDLTVARMKEFSAWLLSLPRDMLTLSTIAENAVRIFSLEYCSVHVYAEGKWHHFSGTSLGKLSHEVADHLKNTTDHPTAMMELIDEQALGVRYSRVQAGHDSLAVVAIKSKYLPTPDIDSIASMIGILLSETLSDRQLAPLTGND